MDLIRKPIPPSCLCVEVRIQTWAQYKDHLCLCNLIVLLCDGIFIASPLVNEISATPVYSRMLIHLQLSDGGKLAVLPIFYCCSSKFSFTYQHDPGINVLVRLSVKKINIVK